MCLILHIHSICTSRGINASLQVLQSILKCFRRLHPNDECTIRLFNFLDHLSYDLACIVANRQVPSVDFESELRLRQTVEDPY